MRTKIHTLALGAFALSAVACDAKAGDDYEGESLLSLEGKVVIEGGDVPSELVPALAFEGPDAAIYYVDVAVRGAFPAHFRLDVLTPPPDVVLSNKPGDPDHRADSPALALGDITAAAPDHPARLAHADKLTGTGWCEEGTGGDPALHAPHSGKVTVRKPEATAVCFRERNACTHDRSSCYYALLRCDHANENCVTLEERGDASLWRYFPDAYYAGKSLNYQVLYLADDARAGSYVSKAFGAGRALARGYHLLAVLPPDEKKQAEASACFERAATLLEARYAEKLGRAFTSRADLVTAVKIAKYNALHHTFYPDWTALTSSVPWEEIDAVTADVPSALTREQDALEEALGCAFVYPGFEEVGPADARDIEVRIGLKVRAVGERASAPPRTATTPNPT